MMKLLEIRWNGEKRTALVEVSFSDENGRRVEHYWLVGELPLFDDDATIRLEFDLMGTIKYEYKADADKAFKFYDTAKTTSDAGRV